MDPNRLVQDCLKGRAEAQRALYETYAPAMLGVCYRYTKSMADAEDVLQDGFVKVFTHLKTYRGEGELGGWIRRIMVTTALNYLKRNARYSTELVYPEEHLHAVTTGEDPEVRLGTKELAALIRQLPSGYQTIFNLHAVEGYSHVEIGRLLGISEGTSRSQYARGRALLIRWIEAMDKDPKTSVYAGKKV